jgi:reactive intermediate/imine deaminase
LNVEGLGRLAQFSHATLSDELIFVSGTLGTTHERELVGGGVASETTQALANIERILGAAGASWSDVLKVSAYLVDMNDFSAMNDAYEVFFDHEPPARITIAGVTLALGARVEFECVARRGSTGSSTPQRLTRRTGFVEHDGETIYYEVVGDGGTPLVLSHGAGGNHAAWFQQVSEFAADRMVITWDHRGYGRSSDHANLSGPLVAVGDLLAVLDELGVQHADLVGQSMGGWSVVGAALKRPNLARRLVLADSTGGFLSDAIVAALRAPRAVASVDVEQLGAHPALGEAFTRRQPALAHLYQSLGRMGSADPGVIIGRLLEVTHDEREAALIDVPTLCVVGDHDGLFPPASIRALADFLPDARVVEITGCGHSPYFEDPRAWNFVVRQFLDSP